MQYVVCWPLRLQPVSKQVLRNQNIRNGQTIPALHRKRRVYEKINHPVTVGEFFRSPRRSLSLNDAPDPSCSGASVIIAPSSMW